MPAPDFYANVNFGQWLSEPGPLPHIWTASNGDPIILGALTANQLAGLAWRKIEHRHWREVDPLIEQQMTPVKSLEGNQPILTWGYEFLPGARQVMQQRIDEQAEAMRAQLITAAPGQVMEYDEAYRQAVMALERYEAGTPVAAGDFPFLDTDIGVTTYGDRKCETIHEVAEVVVGARNLWHTAGAKIRGARLKAKQMIADAATDDDAFTAYTHAWDALA